MQDLAGNQAVALTDQAVTNETGAVDSTDATLSAITVTPGTVNGFAADQLSYEVGVASTVTQATVSATTTDDGAEVVITPTDTDGASGHQVNLSAGQNAVTFAVTAEDDSTMKTYTVNINRGVTDPTGWKAVDDFDTLVAAGNTRPTAIWANATTIWVTDSRNDKIYAYNLSTKARDASQDFDTLDTATNNVPTGLWSDGTTMWVADSQDRKIYAYNLTTKARDSSKDFDTLIDAGNNYLHGIWSDGDTMWVVDQVHNKLFAYNLTTKAQDPDKDLNSLNAAQNKAPVSIWSDGTTIWVTDNDDTHIYTYNLNTKARDTAREFDTVEAAGNTNLNGIWSDGTTMWATDADDDKIYSYNMPAQSDDATLSALTVSPKDIDSFTPDRTLYEVGLASTVTQATLNATTNDAVAEVSISVADADPVADGHQVNLTAGSNTVVISVTAEDDSTKNYAVNINRGVTTDFGWKASDDFDTLIGAGDTNPFSIWSNGTTLWLVDFDSVNPKVNAYNMATMARDSSKDIDTIGSTGNRNPRGLWSDGTTLWVGDRTDNKLYAYNLTTKAHDPTQDFETLDAANNDDPNGLWSDGITMWVADDDDDKIYAYNLDTKARDSSKDFDTLSAANNNNPNGLWSDGITMWVSDSSDDKLYAYNVSTKAQDTSKEFTTLTAAGNAAAEGIWSDGETMLVADADADKIYSYNMPPSDDSTLSALTVSPKDINGFAADLLTYEAGVATTVTQATVTATKNHAAAELVITPADADGGAGGHQVNLSAGKNEVTITVTAEDDATTETYTVNINRGVTDPTGWKASEDFDGLIAAGNTGQRGIAVNSNTMWVVDDEDAKIYAYRKSDGTRDSSRDIPLHSGNTFPKGIWSNETTIWVVDLQDLKVYAYRISDKSRQTGSEFNLDSANTVAGGIHSDSTIMWISDSFEGKLFAYLLADGTRQVAKEFDLHTDNGTPAGIWSNGTTMWVTDQLDDKIYAYSHATLGRSAAEDFDTLSAAGNNNPTRMTGDGTTVWALDYTDKKIYSYNGAISSDATLSTLTVSPKDIIGFDPARESHYDVGLPRTVSRAIVSATANHPLSSVEIMPTDAVGGTPGHQVNLSTGRNVVTITVTAEDDTEKTYRVSINRGVTTPYGWKASDDFDGLIPAGQTLARSITSNDTTMWVLDGSDDTIYAYRKSDGTRNSSKDFDTLTAAGNEEPTGITTNGATMWVADFTDDKLYAYNMTTKARDTSEEFNTVSGNQHPTGIWTDGITMWVADSVDINLYAYNLTTKTRDTNKEFDTLPGNTNPYGIWSDGATMWVADWSEAKILAYDMTTKARDTTKEFNTLHRPYGLWSDGITTWISDSEDIKVYSYNHPASNNADLKTLAVDGTEVSGFNPATTAYSLKVPGATREITVSAEALQFKAQITSITPVDAETAPGHQVVIDKAITNVVFTVTAQNSATKRYTLTVNNDSLTEPPIILSAPDGSVDENAAPGQVVSTITAIDPEGAIPLTFELNNADALSFDLIPLTGGTSAELRTKVTFDYETVIYYRVGFRVSDPGGAKTAVSINININNVDEAGTVNLDPEPAALETELTATIEDPDGGVTSASWTWYRGAASNGPWGAPISGATSDTYTPVAADVGKYLRVVAFYTDAQGPGKTAEGVTAEAVLEFSDQTGYCTRIDQEDGDCDLSKAGQLRLNRPARGTIDSGSDTDWFRFDMAADKIYRIDALAASTDDGDLYDPRLVGLYGVYQRSGSTYAYQADGLFNDPEDDMYAVWYDFADGRRTYNGNSYNDDGGEGLNARMYITGFPAGTHYIEVTTVPHQEDPADEIGSYTLTLTELEDDSSSDRTVSLSAVTSGEIEYPGDTDTFVVSLAAGTEYFVQQLLTGFWSGSHLINPRVENIHADPNTVVSTTYDRDVDADRFTTTTAGNYRITIAGYTRSHQRFATGTYTVQVSAVSSGLSSPLPNSPPVGLPTITGDSEVGETLTADASGITDPDGIDRSSLTYQWLRNSGIGAVAITGATSRTYTIVEADLETQLSVRVSFTDNASNAESVTSTEIYIQTPPPLYGAFANAPANHEGEDTTFSMELYFNIEPSLSWKDVRDHVLTLTNGDVTVVRRTNPQGDNPNIRWTLTIEPTADSDVTILLPPTTDCTLDSAVCTARSSPLVNEATITVPGPEEMVTNSAATGAPTITGTVQVGETLTAGTSAIADADGLTSVAYTYQWLADDVAINNATSSTYTLAAADQAKAIKVTVSFTDDADNAETLTSTATSAVAAAPTPNNQAAGLPTITGDTTVGSTLTAVTSGITDADGMDDAVFSYQWLRSDAAISDATASTYTLTSSDTGSTITVRISFADDAGNTETLTSTSTASITSTPTNSLATGQPTVTGTTAVDGILTASTSAIADTNGMENASFSYQWLRDDADISDATNSTYVVAGEDEGHTIKVRVSFTDDDGFSESVTSAGLDIPVVPLEGFFDEDTVPANHHGANTTFTFELYFSVEPTLEFVKVRDDVLTITNGDVIAVRRTSPQSSRPNSRWEITVQPSGDNAVTIALSPTTDCTVDSAVCTRYGKRLSNSASVSVAGS